MSSKYQLTSDCQGHKENVIMLHAAPTKRSGGYANKGHNYNPDGKLDEYQGKTKGTAEERDGEGNLQVPKVIRTHMQKTAQQ